MQAQDKIRDEIKDFENLLNENRAVNDRAALNQRKDVTKQLTDFSNTIRELSLDRMQLKAMIKNQNYHFTNMQKEIGVAN